VFQAIIRYEIWAALGAPVVPPVNSRQTMSSASTPGCDRLAGARERLLT
jgi:hypothetical protein